MFRWKIFAMLCALLFVTTACVTPQGDEYEKIYYDFMISTSFRLAIAKTDGSQIKEALMLPKNYEFERMKITHFTNQDQNIVIARPDVSYLLDTHTLTLVQSKDLNFSQFYESAISPNGQSIVFGAQDKNSGWDLYLMTTNDLTTTNITNSPTTLERFPSFTQDGQFLVFTSIEFGKKEAIILFNFNTNKFDTLLTAPTPESTPTDYHPKFVSPFLNFSDSLLYYCSFSNRSLVSYSLKIKTNNFFYQNVYPWRALDFTKDGHFTLFIGNAYPHQLIRLDLGQKNVLNITQLDRTDCDYAISEDGSKIAYTSITQKDELNGVRSDQYNYYQLWLTNPDGSKKTFIDSGRWPVFSADGNQLAYYKAYYSAEE